MSDLQSMIDTVVSFCEERDWDRFHNPKDLAIGISTEAGELLDLFRFMDPGECRSIMDSEDGRTKVSDELADVLFFVLRFAQMNGIDLREALESKVSKNAEKYPVEKSRGSNRKYDQL